MGAREGEPVAVVGPGAMGGLLAARLLEAGENVRLIGRDRSWLLRFRRRGLRVSGPAPDRGRLLPARLLRPQVRPEGPPCAAIFFCVKAVDAATAVRRSRRMLGPNTAAVSLLNGLAHAPLFRSSFGPSRTVFGISCVAADRPEPFYSRHQGGTGIVLARTGGNGAALEKARGLLRKAGWDVSVAHSEDRLLWTKAAFNAAANPLGALTGRSNGELAAIPPLKDLLLQTLHEAVSVAQASGHSPIYADMAGLLLRGCLSAPGQPNSMLQDLRAGRRTELAAILSPFLAEARRRSLPAPTLFALYRFMRRLERELR